MRSAASFVVAALVLSTAPGVVLPVGAAPAVEPGALPAPPPRHLPRFEISISYVANLVHWIDNLAGSSQGKTIRSYRQYWQRRFGTPDPEEMELLRSWLTLRYKAIAKPEPSILNASGCLPQREEAPDWRQSFRIRSYESASVDAFVDAMSGELTTEERGTLRAVIEKFRPRFDEAWKETVYLSRFEEKLGPFLEESGLRSFLGEVAAFFGVDPDAFPPGKIELMALPEEGATHAQADGRYLLIEIRPSDGPADQIQVVAHETSHYLWHLVDAARNDHLARQTHAAGKGGSVTWNLLREALPTALGQGLAESRLAPRRFGERNPWYHIEEVDRFAKEIFPIVRAAFRDGKPLEGGVMEEIARRAESSPVVLGTAPSGYLADSFFAVGEGMSVPYRLIRERTPTRAARRFAATDPNEAAFVGRYECLSGVVLLGPEELASLPRLPAAIAPPPAAPTSPRASEPPTADPKSTPADGVSAPSGAPLRSEVRAVRRPGGGIIFYVMAARPEDAERIGAAFLDLQGRPDGPVFLGDPEGPTPL